MGGGRQVQGEGTYVYLWLIHIDVWQKPREYCKAIILQLTKKGPAWWTAWSLLPSGGKTGECLSTEPQATSREALAGAWSGPQALVACLRVSVREPQAQSPGSAFLLNHPRCSKSISSHPGASGSYSSTPPPHPKSPPILLRPRGQGIGSHSSRDAPLHTHTPCWGRCLAQDPWGPCVWAGGSPTPSWGSPQSTFPVSAQGALPLHPTQPLLPILKWLFGGRKWGRPGG